MGRGDADQMWAEQTVDSLMGDNQSCVVLNLAVPRTSSAAPATSPSDATLRHMLRHHCQHCKNNIYKYKHQVLQSLLAIAFFLFLLFSIYQILKTSCKDEQFKTSVSLCALRP